LTLRTTPEGKQISGYAIVWKSPSVDLGGFTEVCSASMCNRTLKAGHAILALRDHKPEMLLGNTAAGTLTLNADSTGLAFTLTLPSTAIGDDTFTNVQLRNLDGVSFGFSTVEDSWEVGADGKVVRTLLDVDLFEISPCSFAAYPGTSVDVRSCPAELKSKLTRSDDEYDEGEEDDEEAENQNGCSCPCQNCREGQCELCDEEGCDDPDCEGCPMKDESRSDHVRVKRLFALRSN
jgi:HK97 family phage prohead protease